MIDLNRLRRVAASIEIVTCKQHCPVIQQQRINPAVNIVHATVGGFRRRSASGSANDHRDREDQRGADYETEKLCRHKEPAPGPQLSGAFGLVDPRKERDRRLDAIAGLEARAKRRIRRPFIDAEQFK